MAVSKVRWPRGVQHTMAKEGALRAYQVDVAIDPSEVARSRGGGKLVGLGSSTTNVGGRGELAPLLPFDFQPYCTMVVRCHPITRSRI